MPRLLIRNYVNSIRSHPIPRAREKAARKVGGVLLLFIALEVVEQSPGAIRGQSEYPWHFSTLRLSSCKMERRSPFGAKHALIELQIFLRGKDGEKRVGEE